MARAVQCPISPVTVASEARVESAARSSTRSTYARRWRPLAWLLAACIAGSPTFASAAAPQPARGLSSLARVGEETEPPAAVRAAAQALFDEGRALMKQGRAREACSCFEESERLEPGLGTRFHLAACYEELGKLATAYALFLEVAAVAEQRGQAEREKVARERARGVEPRLARLVIEVPFASSAALRIERDGALVGSAQWGVPLPIDPGVHRVGASAPGRQSWAAEVSVPPSAGVTRVSIPPLAEHQRPFFAPLSRKLGLAALGIGAGTIALGGVFAAQAISKKNASDREGCSERRCVSQAGLSLRREALEAGDRATWATGLGLVGIGAAAALFWAWPTPGDDGGATQVELSPVADLRSATLRLNGRF